MKRSWDIFCSVVDNFGDVGVCWRLSRILSCEMGQFVRLWVDDLDCFHRLNSDVNPALESQRVDGVEIRLWTVIVQEAPADIVIEGFGVRLPDSYIEAMAQRRSPPAWINLEYLSAEKWVEGCHGLPSPHPRLPLVKHFFFPGYTRATGGLIMERGLSAARDAFRQNAAARAAFWRSLGMTSADDRLLRMALFCYENAALPPLLQAWSSGEIPVACIVPEGKVYAQLSQITGCGVTVGSHIKLGQLEIHAVPFLDLDRYDRLLWACDFNFVRGEDSFVRAQLAARPLVWQAYPQAGDAHLPKVAAFLDLYAQTLEPAARRDLISVFDAWNRESPEIGRHWRALMRHREALTAHAADWAAHLLGGGNLAAKLAEFCENRLK